MSKRKRDDDSSDSSSDDGGRPDDAAAKGQSPAGAAVTRDERGILWEEIVVLERKRRETEAKLELALRKERAFEQEERRVAREEEVNERKRKRAQKERDERVAIEEEADKRAREHRERLSKPLIKAVSRQRSLLQGILSGAQKEMGGRREELRREREEKFESYDSTMSKKAQKMREEQRETLAVNKQQFSELCEKLDARVSSLRKHWVRMCRESIDLQVSNFLCTSPSAGRPILWLPATHTEETQKQLRKRAESQVETHESWKNGYNEVISELKQSGVALSERKAAADRASAAVPAAKRLRDDSPQ